MTKKLKISEILDIVDHIQDQELQDLDFTGKEKDKSLKILCNTLQKFVRKECGCVL